MSHELPLCEAGCGQRIKRRQVWRKGRQVLTRFCSQACVPASVRHPRKPLNVFDVVCQLDVLTDWLKDHGWHAEAEVVQHVNDTLTGSVTLRLK